MGQVLSYGVSGATGADAGNASAAYPATGPLQPADRILAGIGDARWNQDCNITQGDDSRNAAYDDGGE